MKYLKNNLIFFKKNLYKKCTFGIFAYNYNKRTKFSMRTFTYIFDFMVEVIAEADRHAVEVCSNVLKN